MVIHHGGAGGGHYTCLYECLGDWYHFDDMKSKIKKMGKFEDLPQKYFKNCTDLVYWTN